MVPLAQLVNHVHQGVAEVYGEDGSYEFDVWDDGIQAACGGGAGFMHLADWQAVANLERKTWWIYLYFDPSVCPEDKPHCFSVSLQDLLSKPLDYKLASTSAEPITRMDLFQCIIILIVFFLVSNLQSG